MSGDGLSLAQDVPRVLPLVEPRKKVRAEIVEVTALTKSDKERMYDVFSKYYNNHNLTTFLRDLSEKNHVILLRDAADRRIQGFSTLLKVEINNSGKRAIGIYSGDTVLEKEYWGTAALGVSFLKYLWLQKIKNPFRPVYWFLISKGYKTYLLMANNFKTCFPRYDQETPAHYQQIMDEFYRSRFHELYNSKTGIVEVEESSCRLREKVAEVTPALLSNPKIAFFAARNPNWERGHELTCLAKMTLTMPLEYVVKKTFKKRRT